MSALIHNSISKVEFCCPILWRKQQFHCLVSASFGCKCYCLLTIWNVRLSMFAELPACRYLPVHDAELPACHYLPLNNAELPACPVCGVTCRSLPAFQGFRITCLSKNAKLPACLGCGIICLSRLLSRTRFLPVCPGCAITGLYGIRNYLSL